MVEFGKEESALKTRKASEGLDKFRGCHELWEINWGYLNDLHCLLCIHNINAIKGVNISKSS